MIFIFQCLFVYVYFIIFLSFDQCVFRFIFFSSIIFKFFWFVAKTKICVCIFFFFFFFFKLPIEMIFFMPSSIYSSFLSLPLIQFLNKRPISMIRITFDWFLFASSYQLCIHFVSHLFIHFQIERKQEKKRERDWSLFFYLQTIAL